MIRDAFCRWLQSNWIGFLNRRVCAESGIFAVQRDRHSDNVKAAPDSSGPQSHVRSQPTDSSSQLTMVRQFVANSFSEPPTIGVL